MSIQTPSQLDPELRKELKTYYDEESWEEIETLEKDIFKRKLNKSENKNLAEFMLLEFRNVPLKLYEFLISERNRLYEIDRNALIIENITHLFLYISDTYQHTKEHPLMFGNIPDECPTGFTIPPPAKTYSLPRDFNREYRKFLIEYIRSTGSCDTPCFKKIEEAIKEYGVDYTGVVYRGQRITSRNIISSCRFFSTSSDAYRATRFMEDVSKGPNCCFFKINLVKARALKLRLLGRYRVGPDTYRHFGEEHEVLVLGGGKFFQDEALTIPGFKDIGEGKIETYYTHSKNGGGRRRTKKKKSKSSKTRRRSRK